MARELSTGRSRTIGVVFPLQASEVVMHSTYPGLLAGLGDAAEARGYALMLVTSSSKDSETRFRDTIRRRRVDGVVLPAAGQRDRLLNEVLAARIPTVLIGHRARRPGVGWVDSEHDVATYDLTKLMLKGGRQDLVMLNGPATVSACGLRARGFWKAVEEAASPVRWAAELRVAFETDQARAVAQSILSDEPRPGAIICGNDVIARGALQAAVQLGLRVPDDVALSGFDDRSFAATTSPALTTVRMPLHRLGAKAAEMLIAMVEKKAVTNRHIVLPAEVVVRQTTPRSGGHPVDRAPVAAAPVQDTARALRTVRILGPAPAYLASR